MGGLKEIGSMLPPGFRFHPTDQELVCHYLYNKVVAAGASRGGLIEVDLHTREPWDLPEAARLSADEWYFFSCRDRKYATGSRTNRATKSGYWKATGKDRAVCSPATTAAVGMRKTLVFYRGRAPNGVKSGWVMHEFRLENPRKPPWEDWVLCRVFRKTKKGEAVRSGRPEAEQDNAGVSSSPPSAAADRGAGDADDPRLAPFACAPPHCRRRLPREEEHCSAGGQSCGLPDRAAWQYDLVGFPGQCAGSAVLGDGAADGAGGDGCGFLLDVDGIDWAFL